MDMRIPPLNIKMWSLYMHDMRYIISGYIRRRSNYSICLCSLKRLHAYGFDSVWILFSRGAIPEDEGESPGNSAWKTFLEKHVPPRCPG